MKITTAGQLKEAILLLEVHEKVQKELVVEQVHHIYNSLKPANLIRSAFSRIGDSPSITKRIISTSVGLGAGMLSKKLLVGRSTNIFKRMLGSILELTVASTVAKNAEEIKQKGTDLIKKINR